TDYYEETDDLERKAKAWYYKGLINNDLDQPMKAQECFLKALRDEKQVKDYALLGRINNQIGMLYTYQHVYERAIPYLKQANNCFEMIRDTIGQAYVLRDLGRAYTVTQQLIDAIEVYREALPYAPAMGNGTIPNELANIYLEKGEYEVAAKYIDQALRLFRTEESRFPTHLVLGKYYLETAQIDSSEYYLQKALSSPSLQTHAGALKYLSYVKEKQSAWIESITLNKRYEACRDSIDRIVETESIRRMDYFYNYQKIQEALYQSQIKVMKKDKERYLYALIICACVFISLGIYSYWRRREKEIKNQKEILEQTIEKQRQNNLRIKEENRQQIEKLQEQLIAMEKERQEGWEGQQLLQEKRVLEIHNESIDADEKRQSLRIAQMEDSDIYKKIHTEDCVKLTDDEWRALEKLLDQTFNNFTERLKKSYPKISYKEIQVCYLTKIKLSSTKMTKILRYNSSPLRSRLYKKIFKKTGSVQDFNSFIAGF
ncbi:hypothetical protein K0F39_20625, partial [Parabacteroides distasonis]|uniref:tetratricopeptide repeat protein n=1 Tax=Parabacteroides distasonis TaxID=823 RepID=UPI001F2B3C87